MKYLKLYCYYALVCIMPVLFYACDSDEFSNENEVPSLKASFLYTSTKELTFSYKPEKTQQFELRAIKTPWTIGGAASWLTVTPMSGISDTKVDAMATENFSADLVRSCVLTLSSSEPDYPAEYKIAVTQEKAKPYISVSSKLYFTATGGSQIVDVSANVTYQVSSSKTWLTVTPSADRKTLTLKAEPNSIAEERTAVVTLSGSVTKTISVTQSRADISTKQSTKIDVGQQGGTYNIQITADADWTATNNGYSWIELTSTSGKAGTSTVSLTIAPNNSTKEQDGYVYFRIGSKTCLEIIIRQEGLYLTTKSNSLTFEADACTNNLEIASNVTWKVLSKPSWIIVSQDNYTGNKTLNVSVPSYNETTDRSGEIVVGVEGLNINKTIKVVQKGRTFSNLVATLCFDATADTQSFDIDTDGAWTATSNQSWLTLSKSSGTGKASVAVTVTENIAEERRSAIITVCVDTTKQTVLVTQDAHFLTISPSSFAENLPSTGGSYKVSIASDDSWQTAGNASWLTLTPVTGNGNIDITITAMDNPSVNVRRDTFWIQPKYAQPVRMIVQQEARYLRVKTREIDFFYRGGESEPVEIETDGTYQISKEGDWFTIQESGKSFTIIATENTTEDNRLGKVIITLTGLKDGESKMIEIPVIQKIKSNDPDIKDFSDDEDWTTILEGDTHATITITWYGNDEDWNIKGSSSFSVKMTGFDEDIDWNSLIR